jgi:hypothetical protein
MPDAVSALAGLATRFERQFGMRRCDRGRETGGPLTRCHGLMRNLYIQIGWYRT